MSVRETVMKSLMAVGAANEAAFYATLFQSQSPEKFALIVLDPRCLKNPLLEALISDLRILSDLELTPVLLVGALDNDRTSVKFTSQRLCKELEGSGVKTQKLNCASYGLINDIQRKSAAGRMVVLELTETSSGEQALQGLVRQISPAKVIFLQPSGGLRQNGQRLAVINLNDVDDGLQVDTLTSGQKRFVDLSAHLARDEDINASFVMASPLNLLQELFTTKGSGTLMRRAAVITTSKSYAKLSKTRLKSSMKDAFGKPLSPEFFNRPMLCAYTDENYQGGAILTRLSGLPYLSKFWVTQAAQGEGLARDVWDAMTAQTPAFFWRSRMSNPFNDWYMRACDGMQISGDWRVFWKGLSAPEIPGAIIAAASAPHDFAYKDDE